VKISIISDVHVKHEDDQAMHLLLSFLRNPDVESSDAIFLLGDIFDLMIGPHSQYFSRFTSYFQEVKKLLEMNKKIYYIEGNHDFHIQKLYKKFFDVHKNLNKENFKMASEFTILDQGKRIYLSHGDNIEIENFNYRLFKGFVTSPPLSYYANNLMPYFLITLVGEKSSAASRKRNNARYSKESDLAPVKDKFRRSVELFNKKAPHEIFVCGHSHVKDYYISDKGFEYINNGYAQHSKTYISIENGHVGFKEIF
jgi:UDP-2,3-diacylglucosamine hydrolase